jgi:hypothetical protein
MRIASLVLVALVSVGCGTELRALDRAERAFTKNRYDIAKPLLVSLTDSADHFSPADRARYAYLRGMTAYRSEDWREGRRYLSLAVAIDELDSGSLDDSSRDRALQALERMDRVLFRDGYTAAAKAPASSFDPEEAAKAKKPSRTSKSRSAEDDDENE